MIIIDFNQIAIANIYIQRLNEEDMIRHMILNSIRMYNKRYRNEFGQMVIACDGMNVWRKEFYPYYKANRKKAKEDSTMDWDVVYDILNRVRDEIRDNLPYKVLHLEGCEADDIIATLTLQTQEFGQDEPIMIVSSDKDFIQLQKFKNVKQFSPLKKKLIKDENPRTYLFNHVMRGDAGDGVPNVLSHDDTFVSEKNQSPLRQTRIDDWLEKSDNLRECMDETTYRNYQRNKRLIDLTEIPEEVQNRIINTFRDQPLNARSKVLNYLIKKRCNYLIENVEEFYNG